MSRVSGIPPLQWQLANSEVTEQDMIWNFKETNFRATGSKKGKKRKTLMYSNKNVLWNVTSNRQRTIQTQSRSETLSLVMSLILFNVLLRGGGVGLS